MLYWTIVKPLENANYDSYGTTMAAAAGTGAASSSSSAGGMSVGGSAGESGHGTGLVGDSGSGSDNDSGSGSDGDDIEYKVQHILGRWSATPSEWVQICANMNTREVVSQSSMN